jgi:hypothetical protein
LLNKPEALAERTLLRRREPIPVQRLLGNSCTWGRAAGRSPQVARIYVSENKHGNYPSDASCDSAVGGLENCSESFTLPYHVFNVGEDGARRIDELSGYQFPGEYAWSAVPFRGGLGSGGGDAGLVRDKMLKDSLLVIAAGVQPDSVAQVRFFSGGAEVRIYQTRRANSNCVINQEYLAVTMAPGTYQVTATFEEPVSIGGSVTRVTPLPDLVVQP